MNNRTSTLITAIAMLMLAVAVVISVNAEPNGANATQVFSPERGPLSNLSNPINASAGNVTEIFLNADKVTSYWQGFFGNVTGDIRLSNAAGQNLYRWALGTVQGEVYASRNATRINWTGVRCGAMGNIQNEDAFLDASSTNSGDSVNRTFTFTSHPAFTLAGNAMSSCRSTPVNGTPSATNGFWNVFLADNGSDDVSSGDDIIIYTALIDSDKIGFNGNLYDFQMIVGEPGNGSQAFPGGTPTTYYFYVELT